MNDDLCGKQGESYAPNTGTQYLQLFVFDMFDHSFPGRNQYTPLEDIEHYMGCPAESEDSPFEWYSEGKASLN